MIDSDNLNPNGQPPLEAIAMAALEAGRLLMEAGASARSVDEIVTTVACGLGAERVGLRVGYASLGLTIGIGRFGITRMIKVGHIGVNQSLDQSLRRLAERIQRGGMTPDEVQAAMSKLVRETPRHSSGVMAIAVGLACAAFGRLLGADWPGTVPVLVAATIGQYVRREMATRHFNVFLNATLVSFISSVVGGLGAIFAGSHTVSIAMIASILLLVPGIPALNAQNDILEGRPSLGSARAVWVAVILIFITAGLWLGQALIVGGH
jgi:uncharacterized membrane protein YjjP (DUF1212 family)